MNPVVSGLVNAMWTFLEPLLVKHGKQIALDVLAELLKLVEGHSGS